MSGKQWKNHCFRSHKDHKLLQATDGLVRDQVDNLAYFKTKSSYENPIQYHGMKKEEEERPQQVFDVWLLPKTPAHYHKPHQPLVA